MRWMSTAGTTRSRHSSGQASVSFSVFVLSSHLNLVHPFDASGSFPVGKAAGVCRWPPQSNAEVKNASSYTPTPPIRLRGVVFKHRENFAFDSKEPLVKSFCRSSSFGHDCCVASPSSQWLYGHTKQYQCNTCSQLWELLHSVVILGPFGLIFSSAIQFQTVLSV
jgi:hypothetical protein